MADEFVQQATKSKRLITRKVIKKWRTEIRTDKSKRTISAVVQAFHAALNHISGKEIGDEPAQFKLEGSDIFNAVIQLCVVELRPAVRKFLGILPGSKQTPHKYKKFTKIKKTVKLYLTDLLMVLSIVTSVNIQTILLKHIHCMSSFISSFPVTAKKILKTLIQIWGNAEDTAQVLSFLCILRIVRTQPTVVLDKGLKFMYVTYIGNSKFMSVNSLASTNFMRRSLVELFCLDYDVTYAQVFLYIRQLAIQLRSAITVKKKEHYQAVYNWQYVNSLRLWGTLLSLTASEEPMQYLIYPFVQICLGTIKLIPTSHYYPLRFHVIQILIDFSKATEVFIPILPLLLEIMTSLDFDKKRRKVSLKSLNLACLLRLSKSQLQENGFTYVVIDTIYTQLLEYLTDVSHSISFPDLSSVCLIQIKQFLKKCKTPQYARKLKQALEKILQNSKFIEMERSKLTLNLSDEHQIKGWESRIKAKGTPLTTFFKSLNKVREIIENAN